MAKRRKKSSPQITGKLLTVFCCVLMVTGIVFSVLDSQGKLSYSDISAFLGLSESPYQSTEELSVHYIDVGQGDCELIIAGEVTVLIDGGEYVNESKLSSYLKSLNIKKLDYVIGTHPHSDHIGSLAYIIQEFEVEKVILPRVPGSIAPTTVTYEKLLLAIKDKGLKIAEAVPGATYSLGNTAELEIMAPLNDTSDELNNYSVVCMLTHGSNKFLFAGDAESSEENDILKEYDDINADVLKVGHHGSNGSSGKRFLEAVSPKYAVICVGSGNSYGHPGDKAVNRLKNIGAEIYRTDLMGSIVAESDGRIIRFVLQEEYKT